MPKGKWETNYEESIFAKMKNMNIKKVLFFPLLVAIIFTSFLPSCNQIKCRNGYEMIDESCICPEGKFEGFGKCQKLEENEYYGVSDCVFQDTFFIKFEKNVKDKIYRIGVKQRGNTVLRYTSPYIEFQAYDSIPPLQSDIIAEKRIIDPDYPVPVNVTTYGRLYPQKYEGVIKWWYFVNDKVVEICPFAMER